MSPQPITENTLFYSDNLDILRHHITDNNIDLIYLDSSFKTNNYSYSILGG